MATKRVVFSFDQHSLETLRNLQKKGELSSMGTAVRESIQLNEILQGQAAEGFSEIVLRNPKTNRERVIIIPSLQRLAKAI